MKSLHIILVVSLIATLCVTVVHARAERILILGDSLSEGLGVAQTDAFPAVLQSLLQKMGRSDVSVINAGVSGSTSASGPTRLKWQLQRPPDILFLELGANDGLRGLPVSEIRKNLSATIELAQTRHIPILLAGMKLPPNFGADYVASFEALYPTLTEKYHLKLMPFLLDGVAGDPALNQEDGVHPNEKGQKIVAQHVLHYLLPML